MAVSARNARRCDDLARAAVGAGAPERAEADAASGELRGEFVAAARPAVAMAPRCRDADRADPDVRPRYAGARASCGRECVAAYSGLRGRCRFRSGSSEKLARSAPGALDR